MKTKKCFYCKTRIPASARARRLKGYLLRLGTETNGLYTYTFFATICGACREKDANSCKSIEIQDWEE